MQMQSRLVEVSYYLLGTMAGVEGQGGPFRVATSYRSIGTFLVLNGSSSDVTLMKTFHA